jgi:DNA modification methylase
VQPERLTDAVELYHGDCLEVLKHLPDSSVDAVVTDPPYGLEFMGKDWDRIGGGRKSKPGIGDRGTEWVSNRGWNSHRCVKCDHLPHGGSPCRCESPDIRPVDNRWQEMQEWFYRHFAAILPKVKPGGYLAAFGGSRTQHRLACAIEDAGWEVRDCLLWLYGTGFPKGQGCLKPAYEPIVLARRPGPKVLPLGIDECRVPTDESTRRTNASVMRWSGGWGSDGEKYQTGTDSGRYPANVLHDGSDEVLEAFAAFGVRGGGDKRGECSGKRPGGFGNVGHDSGESEPNSTVYADAGTAARFFYCAKVSKSERLIGDRTGCVCPGGDACGGFICDEGRSKNTHPTVKPVALMRWLTRLVTPPSGTVLDPFAGSGTTAKACVAEGRKCILIEREENYVEIIRNRIRPTLPSQPSLFDD